MDFEQLKATRAASSNPYMGKSVTELLAIKNRLELTYDGPIPKETDHAWEAAWRAAMATRKTAARRAGT